MKARTLNPNMKSWKRYVGTEATSTRGRIGTIEGVRQVNGCNVFYGKGNDGRRWSSKAPQVS